MQMDGLTLSHETSETIRKMAVRRVLEGERPSTLIASYGLCRTSIYRWAACTAAGRGQGPQGALTPGTQVDAVGTPETAGAPLDQRP